MSFRRCWMSLLCLFSLLGCDSAVEPSPNPVPVLQSVQPDLLTQGQTSATVRLTGLAFVEGAKAFWNGSERPTEYEGPTRLRISLTAADLDEVGEVAVSAANPEPGGGASESLPVTIGHPAPRIESLSPTSAEAVSTAELTLHVYGSRFAPGPDGAVVRWNGIPLPTTVVTSTELRAEVADFLLRKGEVVQVTVSNPAPGGGSSPPLIFGSNNPVPTLTTARPSGVPAGADVLLSLGGSGFVFGVGVWYGDARLEPESVTGEAVSVSIPGELNTEGESIAVRVENPAPGGGYSEVIEIPVWRDPPRIHELSPASVHARSHSFTLLVLGADFDQDAIVTWDDQVRPATVVDGGRIEVPVDASDLETSRAVEIAVTNPTDGAVAVANFEILPPAPPQIDALSPPSVYAGSSSFTLTILGSAFAVDAIVTWDGEVRSATILGHDRIELEVDGADVAAKGSVEIVVRNPGAGEATDQFVILPPVSEFGADIVTEKWGGVEIVASSIDGSDRTALWVPGGAFRVDASPVSPSVVFHGTGSGSEFRIFVADPNTGSIRRLTGPDVEDVLSEEKWARFSADGQVVYFMGIPRSGGGWELWSANVDGSEAARIEQQAYGSNAYPAPAHGDDRLVYSVGGVLKVLDLVTSETTSLDVSGLTSRWSPNDDWIAYVTGTWQLRLVRPDGTEDHELAPGTQFGPGFDWSPDGAFIIATTPRGEALLVTLADRSVSMLPELGQIGSAAWYGP